MGAAMAQARHSMMIQGRRHTHNWAAAMAANGWVNLLAKGKQYATGNRTREMRVVCGLGRACRNQKWVAHKRRRGWACFAGLAALWFVHP